VGLDPAQGGGSIVYEKVDHDTRNQVEQHLEERAAEDGVNALENAFAVTWVGPLPGIKTLRTHYVQQADVLTITYEFEGEIAAAGALIPLMFYDGREQAVITHTDH
ncbi:glycosyl hydrolase, partial [Clostridioides difficile]